MTPPLCRFRFQGTKQKAWCECGQWTALLLPRAKRQQWRDYWQELHVVRQREADASYCVVPMAGRWRVMRNSVPIGTYYDSRRAALAAICGIRKSA